MLRKAIAICLGVTGIAAAALMVPFVIRDGGPGTRGPSLALYLIWFATSACVTGNALLGWRSGRAGHAALGIATAGVGVLLAVVAFDPPTLETALAV